jgi:anti-sigma factor RsiW
MTGNAEEMADSQALWRMWKAADGNAAGGRDDMPVLDELTLAAYVDGTLAAAERDVVAAAIASNPDFSADVAAAAAPSETADASLEAIIARAQALVAAPSDVVVPFRAARQQPHVGGTSWRLARWGSLVASLAVVSWLGFALGNDAYGSLTALELRARAPTGIADELLDPPATFFDLGEASGT